MKLKKIVTSLFLSAIIISFASASDCDRGLSNCLTQNPFDLYENLDGFLIWDMTCYTAFNFCQEPI